MEREAIELPGWRPGARGAERCRKRIALHLGRPPARAIQSGYLLQRRLIRDPGSIALENKINALQADRDRAGWVGGQVARLASIRPACEIQIAIEPLGTYCGSVRPAIRSRCAEEKSGAGLLWAGG